MRRPTDEEKLQNHELVMKLIEKMPEPRRALVKKMFEGPVGEFYFTAPASSREDFHYCFSGGLCAHSLNVAKNVMTLATALAPGKYPAHQLAFVGLFHDLGKVGDGKEPYYVPNPSEWHRNKGMLYETNKDCVYMPTSERGLYILQKHGIELTPDEYLAIRLNDGMYDDTNKNYRMKEPELALLVHFADRWASEQEKHAV
jgi:hypothetical protein